LFGVPVVLFAALTGFFAVEDATAAFWLLDGEIVIGTVGFLLLTLFFRSKEELLSRYGDGAYAAAAKRFVFPGIAIVIAVVARCATIPGPPIPRSLWFPVMPALGWLLVVSGAVLWLRAVQALGVDNLTMLYVYRPEDSRLADQTIYRMLRHPVYAAALRVALGLALVNGTWFALILAVVFGLGVWGWLRLVEERELLERFGEAYAGYRRRVPAFWPRVRDSGAFLRFLISGG
jgi:protein-S-isoprenylcysteine O-methyltransferase Ste14